MNAKLFKTKKIAQEYIRNNYPDAYYLRNTSVSENTDMEYVDMPNLQWSGESAAVMIEDDHCNTIEIVGWWEEEDCKYDIVVGENVTSFDNFYDAEQFYEDAIEAEKYKDDDEEIYQVKIYRNGEEM